MTSVINLTKTRERKNMSATAQMIHEIADEVAETKQEGSNIAVIVTGPTVFYMQSKMRENQDEMELLLYIGYLSAELNAATKKYNELVNE